MRPGHPYAAPMARGTRIVRPCVAPRLAAGAAGAADCRCSAAAGAGADGAAAGRGCCASLPAAAAPLSALDREAFAIMC